MFDLNFVDRAVSPDLVLMISQNTMSAYPSCWTATDLLTTHR